MTFVRMLIMKAQKINSVVIAIRSSDDAVHMGPRWFFVGGMLMESWPNSPSKERGIASSPMWESLPARSAKATVMLPHLKMSSLFSMREVQAEYGQRSRLAVFLQQQRA